MFALQIALVWLALAALGGCLNYCLSAVNADSEIDGEHRERQDFDGSPGTVVRS